MPRAPEGRDASGRPLGRRPRSPGPRTALTGAASRSLRTSEKCTHGSHRQVSLKLTEFVSHVAVRATSSRGDVCPWSEGCDVDEPRRLQSLPGHGGARRSRRRRDPSSDSSSTLNRAIKATDDVGSRRREACGLGAPFAFTNRMLRVRFVFYFFLISRVQKGKNKHIDMDSFLDVINFRILLNLS